MCQNRRKALIVVLDRHLGMNLAPAIEEILHTRQVLARLPIGLGRLTYDDALHLLLLDIGFAEFEKFGRSNSCQPISNDLAAHVYDITYGSLEPYVDNLVVIDDSIVRGTTLKESIIRILDRLHPRKIVLVSSSPQVRYPDYYGIDMSRMDEFIAFRAAIELLKERKQEHLIDDVYAKSKAQCELPANEMVNYVKEIYAPFADEEISEKMVEMLRPAEVTTPIEIVYQTLDGLHRACPAHLGDWYFSGDYPTPGGVKLLNLAFIDYYENIYSKK